MDGGSVRRRDLLRAGAAIAGIGIGGCIGDGSETGTATNTETRKTTTTSRTATTTPMRTPTATPTATATPGNDKIASFYDDWEDGNYDANPAWNAYAGANNTCEVVERSTPEGGSRVVRMADATDGGVAMMSGEFGADGEWQGPWEIRGLVYAEDIPGATEEDPDCTYHDIWVAVYRVAEFKLTAYDPYDEAFESVRVEGEQIEEKQVASGGIEQGEWYRYSFQHDGDGGYSGSRWRADRSKENGITVTATGSPPRGQNAISLYTSGTGDGGLCQQAHAAVVEHDFIEMRPGDN